MRPDESNNTPLQVPDRPHANVQTPQRSHKAAQDATADLTRAQLDNIYQQDPTHTQHQQTEQSVASVEAEPAPEQPQPEPQAAAQPAQMEQEPTNPYERTHSNEHLQANDDSWQQYHSAWQQYYQQYFYRYYAGHLQQSHDEISRHKQKLDELNRRAPQPAAAAELTTDEALTDIRSQLRSQVNQSITKARGSRHFLPIMAAVAVMLVFLFLQYNRVLMANVEAYISPGAIQPNNIIVDPSTSVSVSSEPRLIIPKINVDVPVVWDAKPDHNSQMAAMAKGVAWFGIPGANSKPGQVGNTVLSGHSSSDWLDAGDYKFIFARLEQMQTNDTIYINYESTRYTYKITKKEVVEPTDVQALIYDTDKPVLTLITCVPLGTANNRLLVTAEQISPDPSGAKAEPETAQNDEQAAMPGQSPTFVERIFGAD